MLQPKLNQAKMNLATPNAAVKSIIIDTYQSERELQEKLVNQTKTALKEFRGS